MRAFVHAFACAHVCGGLGIGGLQTNTSYCQHSQGGQAIMQHAMPVLSPTALLMATWLSSSSVSGVRTVPSNSAYLEFKAGRVRRVWTAK